MVAKEVFGDQWMTIDQYSQFSLRAENKPHEKVKKQELLWHKHSRIQGEDWNLVISWMFKFSSCIHIQWIVLIVPWGPLSLLVVSLTLVNNLHHWLVIEWLYSMFDINTSIFMQGFVPWSGCVGAQDPGLRLKSPGCEVMWHCYDDMHVSIIWMDVTRPWVIICDPLIIGWLPPYLGFIMILFDGWLRPYLNSFTWSFSRWLHSCHDLCIIWQRSQFMYMYLYLLAGFPIADQFPALIYKAFHPSL